MGIRHLNRFLHAKCRRSIMKIPLSDLSGKSVVVDASIYIYKYLSEDSLLESFGKLLALFRGYDIVPIFIFDGKPPVQKTDVLTERMNAKKGAQEQYDVLAAVQNLSEEEQKRQKIKLASLKRQFVRVTMQVLQSVKELLTAANVKYLDAPAEADQLCAYMVKRKKAFACVSDDMDMFAYDCDMVIRDLNVENHECVLYNTEQMKRELNIKQFQEILVLCGTDYSSICWTIEKAFQTYRQYLKTYSTRSYYEWLDTQHFLSKDETVILQETYKLFTIPPVM